MQKLVDQHTEGPNVCFRTVNVMDKTFWRHVNGRSNVYIFEFYSRSLCKSKVCYLGLTIMNENVGYLQIPMYYAHMTQIHQPFKYCPYVRLGLLFFHTLFCLKFGLKITFVAQLSNYIAVPVACKDLMALEDIQMVQLLKYVDLRKKQLFQLFAFQAVELNDFDGNNLI